MWYYSYETFREKIEAAGAKFIACDVYDVEQGGRGCDSCWCGGASFAYITNLG